MEIRFIDAQVVDLLNPNSYRPLLVRWSKHRGFYVENLFTIQCESIDDLMAVLDEGQNTVSFQVHTQISIRQHRECSASFFGMWDVAKFPAASCFLSQDHWPNESKISAVCPESPVRNRLFFIRFWKQQQHCKSSRRIIAYGWLSLIQNLRKASICQKIGSQFPHFYQNKAQIYFLEKLISCTHVLAGSSNLGEGESE